jgi:lysophospholipase L1-like esterase
VLSPLAFLPALLLLVPDARPAAADARAAAPFALADGDRVVFLGSTLIEREQRSGYWELALTARFPKAKVIYRNLGWSGDTVFGEARAGFGNTAHGFKQLKEHVLALKPTVVVIGYGTNESFEGPGGLPNFIRGLNTLLDALAPAKARVVLLSPLRQEKLRSPLASPASRDKDLRLYADAIRDVARKRKHAFVDLYDLLGDGSRLALPAPLTDNGMHPTPWGYWRSAFALECGLGLPERAWRIEIDAGKATATGARVDMLKAGQLRFRVTDAILPPPPAPKAGAPAVPSFFGGERVLRVKGLPAGRHTLTVDGKVVATAGAGAWAKGVRLAGGPEFEQAEKLRREIVVKNELYFHRWRPQNETYLFGFRKHEQGKNAKEITQFDPLSDAREKEIARLRVPVAHTYELKPAIVPRVPKTPPGALFQHPQGVKRSAPALGNPFGVTE